MAVIVHKACSHFVKDNLPKIHEVFCNGECGRPMREDYKSAEEYWRAMGDWLKSQRKNKK